MDVQRHRTEPDLLTTHELAGRVRVCRRTIQRWARQGVGPPPIRVHGRVLYRSADLHAWLEQCQASGAGREG